MATSSPNNWKYLGRKPGSNYRQLFIKGRNIAARSIYGDYMSAEEARTPEQIAADRDLPLEVVLECIAYCQSDPPEIREDWEREEARERERILNDPKYYFPGIDEVRAKLLAEREANLSKRS
jgi:hypothetical protein